MKINNDSLFSLFKLAVAHSELPIFIANENKNRMTYKFINYDEMNHHILQKENFNYIIGVAGNTYNKTVIVPLISKSYSAFRNSDGPGYYYICRFYLTIFVVRNKEIVYSKQLYYVTSEYDETSPLFRDITNTPIPQKYWNGLFRETMREYIERVKWED